jgi:hypothetical protein
LQHSESNSMSGSMTGKVLVSGLKGIHGYFDRTPERTFVKLDKLPISAVALVFSLLGGTGFCQKDSAGVLKPLPDAPSAVLRIPLGTFPPQAPPSESQGQSGKLARAFERFGKDQAAIYSAPFRIRSLKWDALVMAATAGLIATDRKASRNLGTSNLDVSRALSNTGLAATSSALTGIWLYGVKTHDEHAQETGKLGLESVANTFTVYAVTQLLAGRERPLQGSGNGRFWTHNRLDSSFPSGHAMFTWSMASVAAHEYPRPWVALLAYGAATTVSATRYSARAHYPSDVFVGSLIGYLVGTHIFYSHCKDGLTHACRSRAPLRAKVLSLYR